MGDELIPASELRQVKELIWDRVRANLNAAEHDEVKAVLGQRQIEENQSIFEEVNALAEILGDVRVSNDSSLQKRKLFENPTRTLVENEIRMLVDNLRRVNNGNDATTSLAGDKPALPLEKPKDRVIYDYVNSSIDFSGKGAQTLSSSLAARPRTPPSRPQSSRSSRSGMSSEASTFEASAVVEPVSEKLNAYEIDSIKDHLQGALEEENAALLEDVEYLQMCLEDEANLSHQVSNPPSIQELKEFGNKVQGAVVETEQKVEHTQKVERMMKAADGAKGRADKMRILVGESRDFDVEKSKDPLRSSLSSAPPQPIVYLSAGSTSKDVSPPTTPTKLSRAAARPMSPLRSSGGALLKPPGPGGPKPALSTSQLGEGMAPLGMAPVSAPLGRPPVGAPLGMAPLGPLNGGLLRTGSGGGLPEMKLDDIKGPRLKGLSELGKKDAAAPAPHTPSP